MNPLRWRSEHQVALLLGVVVGIALGFVTGYIHHNIHFVNAECSSKAKMSALSKVEMSVSAPFWEFGGCNFDGHGGDEQARAEPS